MLNLRRQDRFTPSHVTPKELFQLTLYMEASTKSSLCPLHLPAAPSRTSPQQILHFCLFQFPASSSVTLIAFSLLPNSFIFPSLTQNTQQHSSSQAQTKSSVVSLHELLIVELFYFFFFFFGLDMQCCRIKREVTFFLDCMWVIVEGTYCTDFEDWDLNLLNSPGAVHSVPSCNTHDKRHRSEKV